MEPEQVEQMLRECYRSITRRRRIEADMDAGTEDKISRVAKWLTGDHKTGLLLYGTTGSGKTTMAKAICELINIVEYSAIASEHKSVWQLPANTLVEMKVMDEERFRKYKDFPMLFIDDIGTENESIKSWGNEYTPVTDLLYHRYDRQLFTILTSNLDDQGLRAKYGERIADRMIEMFDKISYTNGSFRK